VTNPDPEVRDSGRVQKALFIPPSLSVPLQEIKIYSSSIVQGSINNTTTDNNTTTTTDNTTTTNTTTNNNNNIKDDHTQLLSAKERNQLYNSYLMYFGHVK
jgi:hypothetical protein